MSGRGARRRARPHQLLTCIGSGVGSRLRPLTLTLLPPSPLTGWAWCPRSLAIREAACLDRAEWVLQRPRRRPRDAPSLPRWRYTHALTRLHPRKKVTRLATEAGRRRRRRRRLDLGQEDEPQLHDPVHERAPARANANANANAQTLVHAREMAAAPNRRQTHARVPVEPLAVVLVEEVGSGATLQTALCRPRGRPSRTKCGDSCACARPLHVLRLMTLTGWFGFSPTPMCLGHFLGHRMTSLQLR